jgi:hypothetical protein
MQRAMKWKQDDNVNRERERERFVEIKIEKTKNLKKRRVVRV